MIKHVVMIKLSDKSAAGPIRERLLTLPALIEEIESYEVGIDEMDSPRSFHMVLISTFASWDDLRSYNDHQAHQAVLDMIRQHAEVVHVVDYTA